MSFHDAKEPCPGCGTEVSCAQLHEHELETGHRWYKCPRCGQEGCSECMPAGDGAYCEVCIEAIGAE